MNLRIFPAAERAIEEIWAYTERTWGEQQADAYIRGLADRLRRIGRDQVLWKPVLYEDVEGVFYVRYRHHFVFFRRLLPTALGVISVLHENMNLPHRLLNDIADDAGG